MAAVVDKSQVDLEAGGSGVGSGGGDHRHSATTSDGGSSRFSSADGSLYEESRASSHFGTEIVDVSSHRRVSFASECSVEVDLEDAITETNVHLAKTERDCRICHLSLDASNQESGASIELGCSCKNDLAAAHKQCAEAWFRIRGNKTCEICGSTACNVAGANDVELLEQWNEANYVAATAPTAPAVLVETRRFWQGHRFLNFLLACMVFAFVISWLFHFNVPS